jgi:hypothetical protein
MKILSSEMLRRIIWEEFTNVSEVPAASTIIALSARQHGTTSQKTIYLREDTVNSCLYMLGSQFKYCWIVLKTVCRPVLAIFTEIESLIFFQTSFLFIFIFCVILSGYQALFPLLPFP